MPHIGDERPFRAGACPSLNAAIAMANAIVLLLQFACTIDWSKRTAAGFSTPSAAAIFFRIVTRWVCMNHILKDLRIIEGSAFVAAPLAGMTLAQLGADVIRFDPIRGGLDAHRWPVDKQGKSLYWVG